MTVCGGSGPYLLTEETSVFPEEVHAATEIPKPSLVQIVAGWQALGLNVSMFEGVLRFHGPAADESVREGTDVWWDTDPFEPTPLSEEGRNPQAASEPRLLVELQRQLKYELSWPVRARGYDPAEEPARVPVITLTGDPLLQLVAQRWCRHSEEHYIQTDQYYLQFWYRDECRGCAMKQGLRHLGVVMALLFPQWVKRRSWLVGTPPGLASLMELWEEADQSWVWQESPNLVEFVRHDPDLAEGMAAVRYRPRTQQLRGRDGGWVACDLDQLIQGLEQYGLRKATQFTAAELVAAIRVGRQEGTPEEELFRSTVARLARLREDHLIYKCDIGEPSQTWAQMCAESAYGRGDHPAVRQHLATHYMGVSLRCS